MSVSERDAGQLQAGQLHDALGVALTHEAVEGEGLVSGSPTSGWTALGTAVDGAEVGVWEITPGVVRDVEEHEVFVVLSGRATIAFESGLEPIEVRAGSVVRLAAGMRTTWTVHETLRKVYVTPAA
ncbi:MAG TPA: cupin domain-containing protein [Protaetiibacter sp.]|nr:cupin domain-containing protein [Protaetiibacter sp.]